MDTRESKGGCDLDRVDDDEELVDEDAELELSCALHDLAVHVQKFEERMKNRFAQKDLEVEEDISEDIPEVHDSDEDVKEEEKDDDEIYEEAYDDDDEDAKGHRCHPPPRDRHQGHQQHRSRAQPKVSARETSASTTWHQPENDWNEREQKQELTELRHNIAVLLQNMKEQAIALDRTSSMLLSKTNQEAL